MESKRLQLRQFRVHEIRFRHEHGPAALHPVVLPRKRRDQRPVRPQEILVPRNPLFFRQTMHDGTADL